MIGTNRGPVLQACCKGCKALSRRVWDGALRAVSGSTEAGWTARGCRLGGVFVGDAEDDGQVLGIRYSVQVASETIDGEAKEAILPSFLLWLVLRIKGPLYSIPRSNVELNGKVENQSSGGVILAWEQIRI